MTIIRDFDQKCSVCGESSPQPVLASTNSSGYPDLDLRPPEMRRSTMGTWIVECPHCGYVAEALDDDAGISTDFLKSDEYIGCGGYDFKGDLSKRFYRRYLIAKQCNDTLMCFISLRNCAWKCDDTDDENASAIRKQAIPYINELIQKDDEDKNILLLIKSDFLRRSGEFDRLVEEFKDITIGEQPHDNIINFQLEKAAQKDTCCYTIEDVVGQ